MNRRRFASIAVSEAFAGDPDGTRLDLLHRNLRNLDIGLGQAADIIENLRMFLLPATEDPAPELPRAAKAADDIAAVLAELGRRLDPTWLD